MLCLQFYRLLGTSVCCFRIELELYYETNLRSRKVKLLNMDISDMRKEYNSDNNVFLEEHIEVKEPFDLFNKWFQLVKNDSRTVEPNAVFLSTCTRDGYPSGRVVLLKGYGKEGFTFFTHYSSRKGQELFLRLHHGWDTLYELTCSFFQEENNRAALTFYWDYLSRSVRVEGDVEKLPFSAADDYFSKRPYRSQIGALCSDQSNPIASRDALMAKARELTNKYGENQVPRPPLWGGYIVKPKSIEFWHGQTDRIHDRIRFRYPKEGEPDGILTKQGEDGWIYERLCP